MDFSYSTLIFSISPAAVGALGMLGVPARALAEDDGGEEAGTIARRGLQ